MPGRQAGIVPPAVLGEGTQEGSIMQNVPLEGRLGEGGTQEGAFYWETSRKDSLCQERDDSHWVLQGSTFFLSAEPGTEGKCPPMCPRA